MASTQDRPRTEPEHHRSLLPSPVPANTLGQPGVPKRSVVRSFRVPGRPPFKVFLLCLLIPLLLIAGITAWLVHPAAARATITLTAQQSSVAQNITIVAVTGTPTAEQIQAQTLSATATQHTSTPIPATGRKSIPEIVAHGSMTFYNLASSVQTVPLHTVLTASNGVQVVTLAQAVVPPASGNPLVMGQDTVPAQATQPGSIGNLVAHAVTATCCVADGTITARNDQAFTGGQDADSYTFVQQNDIDQTSASLQPQAIQQAKANLVARLGKNEQGIEQSQTCTTQTTATPPAGSRSATFTVSVTATCKEQTYPKDAAQRQAHNAFITQAQKKLGFAYQLQGQPTTGAAQTNIQTQGTLLITIPVEGIFRYQLNLVALQRLTPQLAGKSWREAQAILLKQAGVGRAALTGISGDTLPASANQITITVAN